ncbi:MAG: HAMP domain-containing protein [Chloroflexi bacterium]|nr:HAMP domain-containing protein [Chloroflexota bacterium]
MVISKLRALPIRFRLALWYALFFLIIISAISTYFLTALESSLLQETDDTLSLRASQVEHEIAAARNGSLRRGDVDAGVLEVAPVEEFSAPGIYIQILDPMGEVLATSLNLPKGQLPVTADLLAAALAGEEVYATVPVGRERVRVLGRPLPSAEGLGGIVLVGESLHPLEATLERTQQLIVLTAVGAAIMAIIGGWWLTANALGPVAEVTRVARQIATTGQFQQRITASPARDELGDLTATFNEMIARLEKTLQHQREFLADVSHELRGPLMVIRGNVDILKLDIPEKERQECAQDAADEVERMSRLLSDLLFVAESDAQQLVEHQPVSLDDVVGEIWTRAKTLDGGAHDMVITRIDPVTVLGDRYRLGEMVWNLLENALRYTPTGGRVTLSLGNHGQIAELIVADTGVGISSEHLPRIFERFYRVDRARSRSQGGTGLGLAIVKQTVEAHGGRVRVRSQPGDGTTFTLAIPIDNPQ